MRPLGEYLQRHASYGKKPNDPEKHPAPSTTQHPKRKRRVRTSNKKKDGGMLESPKNPLGLTGWQGVVESGGKVEEYRGRREEACANKKSSVPVPRCVPDEKRTADECGNQRYTVADTVRNFFRSRLLTRGAS